jgi:SHS2 domain-containing protein
VTPIHVVGRGATLREAFAEAALGVFALAVEPAHVEEREAREVRAHGDTEAALLARWIDECLYVHEVEGFVCRRIEVPVFETRRGGGGEPFRLHAFLHGEPADPGRHAPRAKVKALHRGSAVVRPAPDGFEVMVALDLDL